MKTLFCMILAAVAVALGGCETESSDQIAISISPSYVTMQEGESRTFTASGWQDYTWTLAGDDENIGVLSSTKGDSVVYTALRDPSRTNGTLQQILVVRVNIAADELSNPSSLDPDTATEYVTAQSLITIEYTP